MKVLTTIIMSLLACVMFGCDSSPLAGDLAQRDANEIVAVLRERGIEAEIERERGAKGKYSVSVATAQFGASAALLTQLGLPTERKASFRDLVAPSGILPSSREIEALRIDRAQAAEIEDLLSTHTAVAAVGAIVRIRSVQSNAEPSVSVVVQKRYGATLDIAVLQELVLRALPGIKPAGVVVSITEQSPPLVTGSGSEVASSPEALVPFLVFWRVPQGEYMGLSLLLIGLLVGISGMTALAGYIFGQYTQARQAESMRLEAVGGGRPPVERLAAFAGADGVKDSGDDDQYRGDDEE